MKASVRAGAAIKGFDPGYSGTIRDPSRYPRNSCTFLNVFTKSCNIVASVAHQRFRRALVRAKSSVENRSSRSRALVTPSPAWACPYTHSPAGILWPLPARQQRPSGAPSYPRASVSRSASRGRVRQVRASRARAANAPDRWAAPRQFASAFAHGHARQTGRRRHAGIAAVPDGQRLGRRPHPPTPLVQHRCDGGVLGHHDRFQLQVSLHADQ